MLSTNDPSGALLLRLDLQRQASIASRFPMGDIKTGFSQCSLDSVGFMMLDLDNADGWGRVLTSPDFLPRLRAIRWLVVSLEQTSELDAAQRYLLVFLKNLGWCRIVVLPANLARVEECSWVAQLKSLGFLLQGVGAEPNWLMLFDLEC